MRENPVCLASTIVESVRYPLGRYTYCQFVLGHTGPHSWEEPINPIPSNLRTFDTGATRSPDTTRDDPEGFLSPLVIDRFNQYMTKHRVQSDGSIRDSDNWQKGIPLSAYMKGLWRHFLHLWLRHRGHPVTDPGAAANIEEDLCAMMFNVQGYLHETIKARLSETQP